MSSLKSITVRLVVFGWVLGNFLLVSFGQVSGSLWFGFSELFWWVRSGKGKNCLGEWELIHQ